jgi:putative tryptophan/tyrosine transport system substrate-binding protein
LRRREFITLLGGAAVAWPLAARAQQPAGMPVIGFLHGASPGGYAPFLPGFHQGVKEAGYTEGRNVAIEYRWAEDCYDRLPALAADLVDRHVTVIAAPATPAALAAKAATTTIPIVFLVGGDPVAIGLVASLARPGGNLTGVTNLTAQVGSKRLELMHALVPTAITVALLVNPSSPELAEPQSQELQVAARSLGLQLHVLNASTEREIDMAFATVVQLRPGGLVIVPDPFFTNSSERLAARSLRHAIPTIFHYPEFTAAGGLMSYGSYSECNKQLKG